MEISKEWLNKRSACSEGVKWFEAQKETDGVKVVKKLIKEKKLDWANWTICHILDDKQKRQYALFAAEQVAYLWKDKYPKEYAIWKKWVDAGCPENMRAAAGAAARDAAWAAAWAAWDAACDAAWAAWAAAGAAAWVAARDAAWAAMLTKILNYGLKLLGI